MIPVSFLLVLVSQIFLTTVIVRYDHMEKYEAQLLIFAALSQPEKVTPLRVV